MPLHDVLTANRDEVMRRWKDAVRGDLAPESMPTVELLDHLPQVLDEIAAVLATVPGQRAAPQSDASASAAEHGSQRLRLGFSLDSVVREYGALRDAIVETARESDAAVTFTELQVVFDCIIDGIAEAVSEYTRERDTELLRHSNEHFAFIAHELRSPLSAAMLAFQHLQRSESIPETQARAAGALERGLRRTTDLIESTLKMARVASGVELRRDRTTLRAIFEDVEAGVLVHADSKQVEVRVVLDHDEPVDLDIRLVRSAVGNLLQNAVKYTHPGSAVTLRGAVKNGVAIIEIEDRCGGLKPGQATAAFAPFVRLDSAETGFGLGLAIAKQAVDAHGGTIRVNDLPGTGCIFVLELPVVVPG
jgi:signal transduction histidine kinase